MRFYLLGQLRIGADAGVAPPDLPVLRKTQRLLAYLLLFRERAHPREHLAALFWGDVPDDRAQASLRTALKGIRALLPPTGAALDGESGLVRLTLGSAWLDVAALEAGLAPGRDPATRAAALALYTADLLDGWSDEWVVLARERLRQDVLRAGTALLRDYLAAGDWAAGIDLARRLLAHDPLDETLHDLLLRLLLGAGDRPAARRHYQHFAALLRAELDSDPAPATQALYATAVGQGSGGRVQGLVVTGSNDAATRNTEHAPRTTSPGPLRLAFVGRAAERVTLEAALAETRRGRGQMLLVGGEAGAGKTRLVEELLREAEAARVRIARGRAYELDRDVPFAPLLGPLAAWLGGDLAPAQVLARVGPVALAALVQVLPALAARFPGLAPLPALPAAEAQARLLAGVTAGLLAAAAPGTPAVLFLDDLQWADTATIQVLEQVQRQFVPVPLLVLCTYRAEEVPPESGLAGLIAALRREGAVLDLAPLSVADVQALVEPRLPAVRAVLTHWLHAHSEGNAFFVAELLRGLVEEDRIAPDPLIGGYDLIDPLPDEEALPVTTGVQTAVLARFRRLSAPAQALCQVAAAMAGEASFALLTTASELSDPIALAGLEEALAGRFLRPARADDSYLMGHDLIRHAVYGALSGPRRTRLHTRIGTALETIAGAAPEVAQLGQLAYHYGRSADRAKQREYFRRAGDAAQAAYANEAAAEYYARLLPLLAPAERPAILLQLGMVRRLAGAWAAAEAPFQQAAQEARVQGDDLTLVSARRALGDLFMTQGKLAEAQALLEEALAGARRLNYPAEMLKSLNLLAWMFMSLDLEQALVYAHEARAVSQESGQVDAQPDDAGLLGYLYLRHGDLPQAWAALQEAYAYYAEGGDKARLAWVAGRIGSWYNAQDQLGPALTWHLRRLELGHEVGDGRLMSRAAGNCGESYMIYGQYALARACIAFALAVPGAAGDLSSLANFLGRLAELYTREGRFGEARRAGRQATALARVVDRQGFLNLYLLNLANAAWRADCLGEATEYLAELLALPTPPLMEARVLAIRVRLDQGVIDAPTALQELRALLPDASEQYEQAEVYAACWFVDPSQEAARQTAAALYAEAHRCFPDAIYRAPYRMLTGADLPDLPLLPSPPDFIPPAPADLSPLLDAVDRLIAGLPPAAGA